MTLSSSILPWGALPRTYSSSLIVIERTVAQKNRQVNTTHLRCAFPHIKFTFNTYYLTRSIWSKTWWCICYGEYWIHFAPFVKFTLHTDKAATLRKETLLYCVPILVSSLTSEMLWLVKSPLSSMIVIKRLWQTKKQRKKTHQVLALAWSTSAYPKGCDYFTI